MDIAKFKSAGTGFGTDRSGRALLQNEMTTSGFAIESASHFRCMDRATSSTGINRTFSAVYFHAAGSGLRANT